MSVSDSDLHRLSQRELRELRAKVDLLIDAEAGADTILVNTLHEAIRTALDGACPPRARDTKCYRNLIRHAPSVQEVLRRTFPRMGDRPADLLTVLTLCMDALVDTMRDRRIPVSYGTIVKNLGMVPDALHEQYQECADVGRMDLIVALYRRARRNSPVV